MPSPVTACNHVSRRTPFRSFVWNAIKVVLDGGRCGSLSSQANEKAGRKPSVWRREDWCDNFFRVSPFSLILGSTGIEEIFLAAVLKLICRSYGPNASSNRRFGCKYNQHSSLTKSGQL